MLPNLDLELKDISGVGPKYQLELKKLGINCLGDLVYFFPRKIIDLTKTITIAKAKRQIEELANIRATVKSVHVVRTKIRRMWIVEAELEDDSGVLEAVWFNQPYLFKMLKMEKRELIFRGAVEKNNSKIFLSNPEIYREKGIYPIYRQTKKISSKIITKIIKKLLIKTLFEKDLIPKIILDKFKLPGFFEALKFSHIPKKAEDFKKGKYRFLFEELFIFMLVNLKIKQEFDSQKSAKIMPSGKLKEVINKLPFKLTDDQKKSLGEILSDFSKNKPMNRIIQGDVGSGKTIVAFLAALEVVNSGYQASVLAPTEVLSWQHFETFKNLAEVLNLGNLKLALATSSNKKVELDANIVIGTHALFNYNFKNLALVIIDEQQRFGVEQRTALLESAEFMPHYLSLSATPIPRSLAHVIFANCDLSVIKEKPMGRKEVATFLVPESKRKSSYDFIDKMIEQGQQAFIICPLILEGDEYDEKKSVVSESRMLERTILSKRRIAMLHGKMKSEEKDRILNQFRQGNYDILISTSIIEVGVDIPNATIMVIEDAQMFGLSQLHQFRGRVGRSDLKSYCLLFAKADNEKTRERLKAFVQTNDGFELSSKDLKQRGPGSLFDMNQSGFTKINPLWFENSDLLKDCAIAAEEIIDRIETYPYLLKEVESRISLKHLN